MIVHSNLMVWAIPPKWTRLIYYARNSCFSYQYTNGDMIILVIKIQWTNKRNKPYVCMLASSAALVPPFELSFGGQALWHVGQTHWGISSWRCCSEHREFDPHIRHDMAYVIVFLGQSIKTKCISTEPGRRTKLTQVLKLTPVHFRQIVSSPVPPWPRH